MQIKNIYIYHCTLQADILFLSTISVFFRLDATLRREKNLCEQPFALPMSIKTNVKCNNFLLFCRSIRFNDATATRTYKKKKTPPRTTKTTTNRRNMRFNKQNNNFARASHIFGTFLGRFACRDYVVETPNFAFWESLDNQRRNFFF